MTDLLTAAKLALEALKNIATHSVCRDARHEADKVIPAFLDAIEAAERAEPVAYGNLNIKFNANERALFLACEKEAADKYNENCYDLTALYAHPIPAQEKQDPVGLFTWNNYGGWQQLSSKTLEEYHAENNKHLECDRSTDEPVYLYRAPTIPPGMCLVSEEEAKNAKRYEFAKSRAYVAVNPHYKSCLWILRGIFETKYNPSTIHGFDAAIDEAMIDAAQK